MAKLLVADAEAWGPTPEEFSGATEQLHKEDQVRRAVESAGLLSKRNGSPFPTPENKARLLARHLLLRELTSPNNTQAERRTCKREAYIPISAYGKPLTAAYRNGNFSVTHVAKWVCCARSPTASLGVDVAPVHSQDTLPFSLLLSPNELTRAESLPRSKWPTLFALFWTLKEGVLKALGLGISRKLQMHDICLDPVKLENVSVVSDIEPGSIHTAPKHRLMVSLHGNKMQAWSCSSFMLPGDPPHILSVVLWEEALEGATEVLFVSPHEALQN
ncbi:hypothetical protein JKF63_05950 [Porcisia hertigi]|uniref:holo-[acyl-carrier-protein] synthase n=1 Tax=Porcisia hertigi TaxID=2761500 RepID=A0A836IIT8_9TRYP|nr:hypothetical protein JKF63_05950 [Porcisia hertigi]